MPILPASTLTRLSIRKQVKRCAALARPSASNELGKSSICKGRFLCLESVQSAPSISHNHAWRREFSVSLSFGSAIRSESYAIAAINQRLVATLAFYYTPCWDKAKLSGGPHLNPHPGPLPKVEGNPSIRRSSCSIDKYSLSRCCACCGSRPNPRATRL